MNSATPNFSQLRRTWTPGVSACAAVDAPARTIEPAGRVLHASPATLAAAANERYGLQEFLIYKHYNLLTERSFRARLIKVTYKDTTGKQKFFTEYGFMIEDKDLMGERNGMVDPNKKETQV